MGSCIAPGRVFNIKDMNILDALQVQGSGGGQPGNAGPDDERLNPMHRGAGRHPLQIGGLDIPQPMPLIEACANPLTTRCPGLRPRQASIASVEPGNC